MTILPHPKEQEEIHKIKINIPRNKINSIINHNNIHYYHTTNINNNLNINNKEIVSSRQVIEVDQGMYEWTKNHLLKMVMVKEGIVANFGTKRKEVDFQLPKLQHKKKVYSRIWV